MNAFESLNSAEYSAMSGTPDGETDNATIVLGVLNAVASNSTVSQRSVAKKLGIALGLANSYVKRCIKKGWIKAHQVPANRYAYYLTPKGFSEKSRLTAEYLSQGFYFFRVARQEFYGVFVECEQRDFRRIVLHGLTELTEIAVLSARGRDISITAIVDDATSRTEYDGIPVVRQLPDPNEFDAAVITDLEGAQREYDAVIKMIPPERILAPALLNILREQPHLAE